MTDPVPGLLSQYDISPEERQAIQKQNFWGALLQTGMGLMAAGSPVSDAQRAQLLMQSAQPFANMGAMNQAMMQSASREKLNMAAAQRLAQQDQATAEIRKMADDPAFQEQLAGLNPAQRALVTASIKKGDIAPALSMMKKVPADGPFTGTSMDAQARNIVLQGDPTSPQYAAAYAHLSEAKTTFDPATGRPVTISPDMRWARPPAGMQGSAPQANGQPGVVTTLPNGQSVTFVDGPNRATKEDLQKYKQAQIEADTLLGALDDYRKTFSGASNTQRLESITGVNTPLNTSYNNAALLAKGEVLYNLGVLNGPDLDIIRRTLADPSTFKSLAVSSEDVNESIGKIETIIKRGLAKRAEVIGIAPPQATGQQGQDNPLLDEARQAIARGAPRDAVIQRLRERGVDAGGL